MALSTLLLPTSKPPSHLSSCFPSTSQTRSSPLFLLLTRSSSPLTSGGGSSSSSPISRRASQVLPLRYSTQEMMVGLPEKVLTLLRTSPPTWASSLAANLIIFALGFPLLVTGLRDSGIVAAFLLGNLTWRAFGGSGFVLVAAYFVIGTAATKLKIAQKEAQGVAEKKKGRRGPGSVIGSSAAGCVCAFLSIFGVGGISLVRLWELGFVASFCTKLSDTVSSEVGKAYGKTTYLVTNFKIVPRGTEGAVSVEGTVAGLVAAMLLAGVANLLGEVNLLDAAICVLASQIANLGESWIGAMFQDKDGFKWLNNDIVNIINVSLGSILAVVMQLIIQQQ